MSLLPLCSYSVKSTIRGRQYYDWKPVQNAICTCRREPENPKDRNAVVVRHRSKVVGYVPKELAALFSGFLQMENPSVTLRCRDIDKPIYTNKGIELPCKYEFRSSEENICKIRTTIQGIDNSSFEY